MFSCLKNKWHSRHIKNPCVEIHTYGIFRSRTYRYVGRNVTLNNDRVYIDDIEKPELFGKTIVRIQCPGTIYCYQRMHAILNGVHVETIRG